MGPRSAVLAVVAAATALGVAGPTAAQVCAPRTALVLSGGGARGLAHIGVLEVLDSIGVRPDWVVGTSMGAVVGALYASGYRATQIDSILRAAHLATLFQRFNPQQPQSAAGFEPLLTWSLATGGLTFAPNPAQGARLNAIVAALALRGNVLARGDFDRMPIPFRAVATRLNDGQGRVLHSGDLGRAIRASMSIPGLFDPIVIDGERLIDGGLAANVPIGPARAAGARRVIVSDVSEGLQDTLGLAHSAPPTRVIAHLLSLLSTQPPDSLGPDDVLIQVPATGSLLDFSEASAAARIAEGRRVARAALAGTACLPRRAAAVGSPRFPTTVGAVRVETNPSAARDVARALHLTPGARLDLTRLRADLLASPVTTGATAIWLTPEGTGDTVGFRIALERPGDLLVGIGAAFDYDQGGRLDLGVGGRPPGTAVTSWSLISLDRYEQSILVGISRGGLWWQRYASLGLHVRGAETRVRVFDAGGSELAAQSTRELTGFAGIERQLSERWQGALGLDVRAWREPARTATGVGGLLRVQRLTSAGAPLVQAEADLTDAYLRVHTEVQIAGVQVPRTGLRLVPFGRYGWGRRLPLQATFPLGGDQGFPGLTLGERRGSREVLAGIALQYPLAGALFAEAAGQGGATDGEGDAVPEAAWLWGARLGVGADTPIGPVRIEYGRNSLGRGSVYVRLGSWW